MFSAVRKRFTYANILMTVALVFAMTGGAYAAKHYLITSTKQISPKVLKQLKGKTGPAGSEGKTGPQGAQGPQGPLGPQGVKGENGVEGKAGTSVTSKTLAAGNKECPAGGSEFKAGASTTYACNGQPWTAGGTLPSGRTEKGTWAITVPPAPASNPTFNFVRGPISFDIPLETEPTAVYLKPNEKTTECPGSAAEPSAEPGFLCVYTEFEIEAPTSLGVVAHKFGAMVAANQFEGKTGGFAQGSWAVTAP